MSETQSQPNRVQQLIETLQGGTGVTVADAIAHHLDASDHELRLLWMCVLWGTQHIRIPEDQLKTPRHPYELDTFNLLNDEEHDTFCESMDRERWDAFSPDVKLALTILALRFGIVMLDGIRPLDGTW